jgi:hypothetical protein
MASPSSASSGREGAQDIGAMDLLDLQVGPTIPSGDLGQPIVSQEHIPIPEYRMEPGPKRERSGEGMAVMKDFGKIPLSILLSFGLAIGVAALWGGVAMATGFIFNIFAVGVAAAAAAGLIILQEDRNIGLGLLGAFIGLIGIFCGKYFIAKWAVMPHVQDYVDSGLDGVDSQTFNPEEMSELLKDPDIVYNVTCMQLSQEGQFSQETAMEIIVAKITEKDPSELSSDARSAREKIASALTEWNDDKKAEAIRMQYGPLQRAVAEKFLDSKVGSAITTVAAFIGSFSLSDLIFFPIALWTAFKIGNGSD